MLIRNLVFDLGCVLIEYRCRDMLMEYGFSKEEAVQIMFEVFDANIWDKGFDMGKFTLPEVVAQLSALYPNHAAAIAWFLDHAEDMVVPRPEIYQRIRRLKDQGYAVYLLSNYSKEMFAAHTRNQEFLSLLDGGVVSCQVQKVKPDPEIYRTLLEKYGLLARECVFFDDQAKNVTAARQLGIPAIQVTSRAMLAETLDRILEDET